MTLTPTEILLIPAPVYLIAGLWAAYNVWREDHPRKGQDAPHIRLNPRRKITIPKP